MHGDRGGGGQAVAPGTLKAAEGSRGETPRPADKWQRCKGALGANGEAEPGGGAGPPLSPNTGRAPPLRAACPRGNNKGVTLAVSLRAAGP